MVIRLAGIEDEASVCALWGQLSLLYGAESRPEILKRSFRFALDNPGRILVFTLLVNDTVVGTGSLHQGHYSTWSDRMYGHLEDLIILEKYRGRGFGHMMILHIIEQARELGLCRLELNTLKDNKSAHRLYEKLGFKSDAIVYEMPLV